MKTTNADTSCPCGTPIHFVIKKPTLHTETIVKHKCSHCGSSFLVKCRKKGDNFPIVFELLELSEFAKHVIQWRIENKEKSIPSQRNFWGFIAWIFGQFQV